MWLEANRQRHTRRPYGLLGAVDNAKAALGILLDKSSETDQRHTRPQPPSKTPTSPRNFQFSVHASLAHLPTHTQQPTLGGATPARNTLHRHPQPSIATSAGHGRDCGEHPSLRHRCTRTESLHHLRHLEIRTPLRMRSSATPPIQATTHWLHLLCHWSTREAATESYDDDEHLALTAMLEGNVDD